jgi:hypothetical protein
MERLGPPRRARGVRLGGLSSERVEPSVAGAARGVVSTGCREPARAPADGVNRVTYPTCDDAVNMLTSRCTADPLRVYLLTRRDGCSRRLAVRRREPRDDVTSLIVWSVSQFRRQGTTLRPASLPAAESCSSQVTRTVVPSATARAEARWTAS